MECVSCMWGISRFVPTRMGLRPNFLINIAFGRRPDHRSTTWTSAINTPSRCRSRPAIAHDVERIMGPVTADAPLNWRPAPTLWTMLRAISVTKKKNYTHLSFRFASLRIYHCHAVTFVSSHMAIAMAPIRN